MLPVNKLFNIQRAYLQLLGQIEAAEGEITEEIDQALQFNEQRLQTEGADVGMVIKTLEYWEETIVQEIKRLEAIKHKTVKGKELLKNRLSEAMKYFGIERISEPTITISFRKSEAVEITDEAAIPNAYLIQPPAYPGKTMIKEALKAGIEVPGAELVTRQNLQIK